MASDVPALRLSIFRIGGSLSLRDLHLHFFYVGTSLSLIDCVNLLDFADCWVELDDFANLIDAILSHELVLMHFALVVGFRFFWLWLRGSVGCRYPLPASTPLKPLLAFTLCPHSFLGLIDHLSRLRLQGLCRFVVCMRCTCKAAKTDLGRETHEVSAPLPSSPLSLFFGRLARDD